MGEARQVMDRLTQALIAEDMDAIGKVYAVDAVAQTPELGEIKGRDQIRQYLGQFISAFSEIGYELVHGYEDGNVAIDEGYFTGLNTGELESPVGEMLPATGKRIRMRECDVVRVENGLIASHRFYYDQLDFLTQLGLAPETP